MAKKIAKKAVSDDGQSVSFVFEENAGSRIVSIVDFPPDIQARFAQHGISQKIGDSYNKAETPAEALNELETLVAQLQKGDWRAASEGGPKAGKTVTALFRIAERETKWARKFMGLETIDLPAVREWFASQTDEMKKTVSGSKEVKLELAAMQTESANESGTSLMG